MKSFYIVTAFLLGMFWMGCKMINPSEKIPTYVHIDSFAFRQPSAGQGTASHDITSVSVYYNNNPVGFFDLPATFPVITTGDSGVLTLSPAVTVNGLHDFQSTYQYYTFDNKILKTNPGKVATMLDTTGYNTLAHFPWSDDFESGNGFTNIGGGNLVVDTNAADVFEGHRCGRIDMQPDSTFLAVAGKSFSMDPGGQTYLELNYRCSTAFEIGVQALNSTGGDATVFLVGGYPNPNGWKKMYISIQAVAQQYPNGQYYILIKGLQGTGGYILLDNLKVVGDQ
jgi:hypothetical protein